MWISGFRHITDYLTAQSLCQDLDEGLSSSQRADSFAFSSFIFAHAAPLLDLSLYVSAANWSATTRPAYSKLLQFPLTWTIPPLIRHEAIKRVEHLGLAELDTDFDPHGALHLSTGRDALPETFRRHLPLGTRRTVRDEMTPEQATAIRLFGLTEDCLSVLDSLFEPEEHNLRLLRPQLSSLDCLAFGYLALMRDAPVPRSFLKDWIESKAPRLSAFVDDIKASCIEAKGPLPWVDLQHQSALSVGARTLDTMILNTPGLGEQYATEMRQRAEKGITGLDQRAFLLAMSMMVTGVAVGYGLYFYKNMPPFGARSQLWRASRGGSKLSQFGGLGFMLDSALGPPQFSAGQARGVGSNATDARLVETDTDVD